MARAGYSFETDMANFVRENLRDHQQVRSKGTPAFSDPPLVTQTTTILKDSPLPAPVRTAIGGSLLGGGSSHPWEVTCFEDNATVAPGYMFGVIAKATTGSSDTSLWDFVWIPTKFDGLSLPALTGTRYIYAKMSLYDGFNSGGSDIVTHLTQRSLDYVESESRVFQPYGSITVYDSANAPSAEGIPGGEQWIVPIAKVVVTDGIAAVEEQYLTHNPTQQMGFYTQQLAP